MGWLRLSSQGVQKQRTSRASRSAPLTCSQAATGPRHTGPRRLFVAPTRTALRHYVGPFEMGPARRRPPRSYVPWLHGRYPLPSYYGRSDPGRPVSRRPPWFPDSRHQNFQPFCLQPSAVLDQTCSTPSTLAALFCSGFAFFQQARQHHRPNRVHAPLCLEALLRTGRSLPVALHPGVSPRCSYVQLLALQCRPGQGLSPCCSDALSGALGLVALGLVALRRVAPRPAAQRTCDRPAQSTTSPPAERGWNCRSATSSTFPLLPATSDDTAPLPRVTM